MCPRQAPSQTQRINKHFCRSMPAAIARPPLPRSARCSPGCAAEPPSRAGAGPGRALADGGRPPAASHAWRGVSGGQDCGGVAPGRWLGARVVAPGRGRRAGRARGCPGAADGEGCQPPAPDQARAATFSLLPGPGQLRRGMVPVAFTTCIRTSGMTARRIPLLLHVGHLVHLLHCRYC